MKLKDRYLVVAGIISGRNFPIRQDCQIMAEAKFNGHVLSIDSVVHTDAPQFEEELAWELDKKSLHQHKLQRSCLKIQFFAIGSKSPVKEFVGYILLDLRSISTNRTYKYFPLLHSKYKNKPEILCCIYLDEDGQEVVNEENTQAPNVDPKSLIPRLVHSANNKDTQYYQIGPDKLCKTGFVLLITIVHAENLTHLIPTDIPISQSGDNSFYFYYELFGNHIISDKFSDLSQMKSLSERISVNILSTVDLLKIYLSQHQSLPIHLCINKHSLGIANIPMGQLMTHVDHSFHNPAQIIGTYPLFSSNYSSKYSRNSTESDRPNIHVNITLQKVDNFTLFQPINFPGVGETSNQNIINSNVNNNKPSNYESPTHHNKTQQNQSQRIPSSHNHPDHALRNNEQLNASSFSVSDLDINNSNKRHLCYTIELRSIRNLSRADHTKRIYTRYVYPMFGSAAPIMTHPPIEIRRDQEVILPQGYCAFEFGAYWSNLERKLFNNPLVVEIYERDKTKDSDTCIGHVSIPLNKILSESSSKSKHKGHMCLTYGGVAAINDDKHTGELVYNLMLEDFGPIIDKTNKTVKRRSRSYSDERNDNDRQSREYQAALELELWKENEEAAFMAKLKEKENQTINSLTDEWKRRDKEREILIKKKVTEYEELEKALRTTIINLAQRERQLAAGEIELQRLRKDLEAEVDRRTSDLCDASKRMEQDCQHQNLMLSSHVDHWKGMAQDWQNKYQQLDREFTQYKAKQSNSPETKLQSELSSIHSENRRLEDSLDAAIKSKDHYKKQWVRALNEVARLKQKHDKISKDFLKRQEDELEQLKLKYKTMDSVNQANSAGGLSLDSIKHELNRLREEAQSGRNESSSVGYHYDTIKIESLSDADQESVMQLIQQRDILLHTGMYSSHDPVIQELDGEIRKIMERNK